MMIRRVGVVLAAAGLALAGLGCAGEPPTLSPPTPVRVAAAGPAAEAGALRYSAALLPSAALPIGFKLPGYVAEITRVTDATGRTRLLQEGDRVRRGQTLARLRTDDFVARVNQARSQQAEVAAALSQARQAYERAATLYEAKSLTRGDYDAARAAYETVLAKQDGVHALVSEAENALEDAAITSPLDGIVINRMIEVGSLVGAGTPGFVVADVTAVKVRFGAPELVVRRLGVGQVQAITTETHPNERFEGRITSLAPAADPGSLVFDVEITIPNADGRLKPGMVASIAVQDEVEAPQTVLPLAAIVRSPTRPDGYAVFVIEERDGASYARLREVTLGRMVSNGVAVTAGLRDGERMIVTGARMVADGEAVEVVR